MQIGVHVLGSGFSVRLAEHPDTDPLPALHALLDLPAAMAKRCVVVLDEFQSLAAVPGAEGIIRSHAQHQREVASYIFAGSEPHMVAAAFISRGRPFYGQVEMLRLGRLPADDTVRYLGAEFELTGRSPGICAAGLIEVSQLHPQRTMLLAELLWRRVPQNGTASETDLAAAVRSALEATGGEAHALLDGLNVTAQPVLGAATVGSHAVPLQRERSRLRGF